jgi:hypothetical protein
MVLSQDYDSDEDVDYCPSKYEEDSKQEYDSKADISEESPHVVLCLTKND